VATCALAKHLGAEDLIVFIEDPDLGALLPAPGFPQTLPGGQTWRAFLARTGADGCHSGVLPVPGSSGPVSALGVAAEDGSVLVLLGGNPECDAVDDVRLLLPLLSTALQGENVSRIAAGHQSMARESAGQAKALTEALGTTRRNLQQALGDAKAAHHRLAFLAEASTLLSSSLDYETTLANVARLVVSALADLCIVDIAGADQSISRLGFAHADPAKEAELRELQYRYQLDPRGSNPVAVTLRTGTSMIGGPQDAVSLITIAQDAHHLSLLEAINPQSFMCVPMIARGRTIGVITFLRLETGRFYGSDDLALAEDLARRAATAVDHAHLYRVARDAEEQSGHFAERVEALAQFSQALSAAGLTPQVVLDTAAHSVTQLFDDRCVIYLRSKDRPYLRPVAMDHPDPTVRKRMQDLPASTCPPAEQHAAGVIESGQALMISGQDPITIPTRAISELLALEQTCPYDLLIVPLRVRDQVIGTIGISRDQPGRPYTLEDQTFLQELADRAATAIENTRLHGQLADRERRLQELIGQLFMAQEEERRRVAYEVHDELAQVAASTHQHLQAFARYHQPGSPEAREALDQVTGLAHRTVSEARRIIANLRPTALDDFGLAVAIRLKVEELQDEGWEITYQESLGGLRLPSIIETAFFRVTQEALTNVRKHAETTRVRIALETQGRALHLEIQDWGRGFDMNALSIAPGAGERIGLVGMRERITVLGGTCRVDSQPRNGTRIVVELPVPVS
jgi:signal transduction histidine kinase